MSDTVESVARAICQQENEDCNLSLGGDGKNFLWMEYVRHAEAAINTYLLEIQKLDNAVYDSGEP